MELTEKAKEAALKIVELQKEIDNIILKYSKLAEYKASLKAYVNVFNYETKGKQ